MKKTKIKIRKVFLDELPTKEGIGVNKNKQVIDWENSIGRTVRFIYDDIEGELEILDCNNKKLKVKYKDEIFDIMYSSLRTCQISCILGVFNKKYIYSVGDIIEINNTKIKILSRIKIQRGNSNMKGYKYKCLKCGNEDRITENNLNNNYGCGVCSNQKVLKGYNDLWTTHPHIAKLLKYQDRGHEISYGRSKKEWFVCPDCGNQIHKIPYNILYYGLSCDKCGNNTSIPEKIMFGVLDQLNIDFDTEKTFKWSKRKRYDFYFEHDNEKYIIETHGKQHYEEHSFNYMGGKTLEEEQSNDRIKKQLALENGIKHYIVIDCRRSESEYIKNSIINSKLAELFDISSVDWNKVGEFAYSSLIKKACELWNSGVKSTKEIAKILKICKATVIKYLKQGAVLGWCDYNPKEEMVERVICLNTNEVFESITKANRKYNFKSPIINACCSGRNKSAGKHPITGEKLKWMYYDEYISKYKDGIKD